MAMDFRLFDPQSAARGVANANAWADAAAKRKAGALLADGDPRAAMGHFQRNGMLGDAMNVEQNIWANENREIAAVERERAEEDRQRRIQMEDERREAEALGKMATNLQAVLTEHGVEAVLPAFDQMSRSWLAQGATPEQIGQMREALAMDPERFLTATAGAVDAARQRYQVWQAGGSVGVFDRRTGDIEERFRAERFEEVDPTKDLYRVPGIGGLEDVRSGGSPAPRTGGGGTPQERNARLQAGILAVIPNARMGSGVRTPERQAELVRELPGIAVPNSRHPTGDAQDFQIPGKGKDDLPEVEAMLRNAGVEFEDLIYHNNHFHIERGPNGGGSAPAPSTTRTGEPLQGGFELVRRGTPRQTTTNRFRPLREDELAQYGFAPGTSAQINEQTGQVQVLQSPRSSGSGGTSNRGGRLPPQQEIDLQKMRTQARELQATADLYTEWMTLNREVDTGGLMALPGAAEARGALDPRVARMNAIQARLTPQQRQGMPGAASDRDVAMFTRSTVRVGAPREANEATARAGIAFAQRQGDYVAFMEQYARDNGTILGAQELWNQYAEAQPLFSEGRNGLIQTSRVIPWRQYFARRTGGGGNSPAPSTSGGNRRRRYNPETGKVE